MSYSNIFRNNKDFKYKGLDASQKGTEGDTYSVVSRPSLCTSFNKGDPSRRQKRTESDTYSVVSRPSLCTPSNKGDPSRREKRKEVDTYSVLSRPSLCTSFNNGGPSRGKHTKAFKSVRLSITDILQREERQTENSIRVFPLLGKGKHPSRNSVPSESKGHLEGINSYYNSYYDRIQKKGCTDPFEDMDTFTISFEQRATITGVFVGDSQEYTEVNEKQSESREEKSKGLMTKGVSLPPEKIEADCNLNSSTCTGKSNHCGVMFGVRIEYMTISKTFKVDVKRFGNLPWEHGKKRILVAKVSMFPGNIHKQKLKVSNGVDTPLDKPSAYFRGISLLDLKEREIGVGIYIRRGLFRRLSVIYEWKLSMENVDLTEPVTVWRNMDCIL